MSNREFLLPYLNTTNIHKTLSFLLEKIILPIIIFPARRKICSSNEDIMNTSDEYVEIVSKNQSLVEVETNSFKIGYL